MWADVINTPQARIVDAKDAKSCAEAAEASVSTCISKTGLITGATIREGAVVTGRFRSGTTAVNSTGTLIFFSAGISLGNQGFSMPSSCSQASCKAENWGALGCDAVISCQNSF